MRRQGVFGTSTMGSLGETSLPDDLATRLDERTKLIVKRLDEDARNRRFAMMIAGASALFAAVKLGIIAFPALKSKITRTTS